RERSRQHFWNGNVAPGGQILLPPGDAARIEILPEAPWLPATLRRQRVAGDQVLPLQLERGIAVSVSALDHDGAGGSMQVSVNGANGFLLPQSPLESGASIGVPANEQLLIQARLTDSAVASHRASYTSPSSLRLDTRKLST